MMPLVSAILDCIPEGLLNLGIPIALDQVFKSFSVGRGGIRDVWSIVSRVYAWGIDGKKRTMIGEPSFQFSFVPFVVS